MIQRNLDSAEMPQMVSVAHSLCGTTLAIISPAVFWLPDSEGAEQGWHEAHCHQPNRDPAEVPGEGQWALAGPVICRLGEWYWVIEL